MSELTDTKNALEKIQSDLDSKEKAMTTQKETMALLEQQLNDSKLNTIRLEETITNLEDIKVHKLRCPSHINLILH